MTTKEVESLIQVVKDGTIGPVIYSGQGKSLENLSTSMKHNNTDQVSVKSFLVIWTLGLLMSFATWAAVIYLLVEMVKHL